MLLDVSMTPSVDDVVGWSSDVFARSPEVDAIRTGALFPAAATAFADGGFSEIDRLALLERPIGPTDPLPPREGVDGVKLRALRHRDLERAGVIDAASFGPGWQNDARTLDDIRRATPRSRSRRAATRRADVGFAITGLAAGTGYLQRIAVVPEARRRGVARLLVDDAIRWLARRGADRVLVNTGIDNAGALDLYADRGFRRRADELVVMERRR